MIHRRIDACLCFLCYLALAGAATTTEFVALVPNAGGPPTDDPFYHLQWVQLEYPSGPGARSSADVRVTPAVQDIDALGAWQHLVFDNMSKPMLTAKIHGEKLHLLINTGIAPVKRGGCCADTIRIIPRMGAASVDVDVESLVKDAFPSLSDAHATHTFFVTDLGGEPVILFLVQYSPPRSKIMAEGNIVKLDAVMAVSLTDGSLVRTADGDKYFDIFDKLGTFSLDLDATRSKIQYCGGDNPPCQNLPDTIDSDALQEWHANGISHFLTRSGTSVLAITSRDTKEVVLLKDPFSYRASEGGSRILQRFGTPTTSYIDSSGNLAYATRHFGLQGHVINSVHNVWYQLYDSGRETLTIFANGVTEDSVSHLFEFDLKLMEDEHVVNDASFATDFKTAACSFSADRQGGARPLGNGVWIVASGTARFGIEIIDTNGPQQAVHFTEHFLYDPFAFFHPAAMTSGPMAQLLVM